MELLRSSDRHLLLPRLSAARALEEGGGGERWGRGEALCNLQVLMNGSM